jgi:energy-converting hydrogenase A subunit R
LAFPYENTYCTKISIDKYSVSEEEKRKLKKIAQEIAHMLIIEIPSDAKSLKDFTDDAQKVIRRLDEIFWLEIARMDVRVMFLDVNPVGGVEKAEAIKDVIRKLDAAFKDVVYVGDSITDEEAFKLVKENNGLTVSFNGNQYAVENAEIAIQSESTLVTAVIADIFCKLGKQNTLEAVTHWNHQTLERSPVSRKLLNRFFAIYPRELPKVNIITERNVENLAKESLEFREKVRGEAIGGLG